MAQSIGPNSPSVGANNTGIGSIPWSSPGSVTASDNTRATVSTRGVSNYLEARGFGFAVPSPALITGIQLDVERSTSTPDNVALLNAWATGLTRTVSAGTNRCLVVTYAQENGNGSRDITAMTYGGRAMTQAAQIAVASGSGFNARIEVWYLLEADLVLASGTTIVPTYSAYTPLEYCEAFSSAVFQHVDQLDPVSALQTGGAANTSNPHQFDTAMATLAGSMAINVVMCGNNTAPESTNGGTNTYAINSGYTEGTDLYFANTVDAPASGASMQTAHKAIATAGTEQPACTFNGNVNRWAMVGLVLQRARELDHSVRLLKGGVVTGSDLASSVAWPATDTYVTYGGATELWGTSWSLAEVNAADFGAVIAARVQNATARVDHMRLTVYYYSTLPVELIGFRAWAEDGRVKLWWATASERYSERFEVLRSADGHDFRPLLALPAAGHSDALLEYEATDERAMSGTVYYRLKQVDEDGSSTLSPIVSVQVDASGFLLYPNPTAGALRLAGQPADASDVIVLDAACREVLRTSLTAEDPIVNLERLPDGSYTILVRQGVEWRGARAAKQALSR